MKILLPLFIFSLFLTPSLALVGGDEIAFHVDRCEQLNVTITPYEPYEWSVVFNCSNHKSGKWICNCTDDWDIFLRPKYNSVGVFDILIEYVYSEPEPVRETVTFSYPSHTSIVRYKDITLNLTKTIEKTIYINDTVECENVTMTEYINQTVEKPLTTWDRTIDVLGYLMLILIIMILVLLVKFRKSIILLVELLKK